MRHYLLAALAALCFTACTNSNADEPKLISLEGLTMGSTFKISYVDSLERDFSLSVDSFLRVFNRELSTYDSSSRLSRFNDSATLFLPDSAPDLLLRSLEQSRALHARTQGWFNPTVMPLVQYWGFGKGGKAVAEVDSALVDSLRNLARIEAFAWEQGEGGYLLRKPSTAHKLDVNAMAPGYAADLLADFFERQGIQQYLIDIGGEMRAKGKLSGKYCWRVGINKPEESAGSQVKDILVIARLCDQALATSGNYRKYREANGRRYAHTLNPHTGYPAENELLSVTIVTKLAVEADAFATACLAMGLDKALAWVEAQPDVEAFFIYGDAQGGYQTKLSSGMGAILEQAQ